MGQSDAVAAKWYRKAAYQGHANAQAGAWVMFEEGRGVDQSDATALKWYCKAADQG